MGSRQSKSVLKEDAKKQIDNKTIETRKNPTGDKKNSGDEPGKEGKTKLPVITPNCFICRKRITDSSYMLCTEKAFHCSCFKCFFCGNRIKPGHHSITDRLVYCRKPCVTPQNQLTEPGEYLQDHLESDSHSGHRVMEKCAKCKIPVLGTDYVVSYNLVWHRVCFRCDKCRRVLTPTDHAMKDDIPYCKYPCFQRLFLIPAYPPDEVQ